MWKNGSLSCENKFIFTRPGRFIVTAILLDSSATACELRVSFFVKVSPAIDDQSDGEFIVMAQITAILLGLIGVFFFLEPFLEQGMKECYRQHFLHNPHTPIVQKVADEVVFRRFQGEGVKCFKTDVTDPPQIFDAVFISRSCFESDGFIAYNFGRMRLNRKKDIYSH